MKLTYLLGALALLASPSLGQQAETEREVRIERRVLTPPGVSTIIIGEDGEQRVIATPRIEIIGDGSHFLHLGGTRRHIGVQLSPLTPELRKHFGVDGDVGIMASKVLDGPAADAGIEVGDIITGIDGEEVDSSTDLTRVIRATEDGETVAILLSRDGREQTIDVAVESREPANIVRLHTGSGGDHRRVLVLPEIHMKDFTLDTELLEGLTQGSFGGHPGKNQSTDSGHPYRRYHGPPGRCQGNGRVQGSRQRQEPQRRSQAHH